MDCTHLGCLELGADDGQTSVCDACCSNGVYAACAHSMGITVCYLSKLQLPPLLLTSSFLPAAALGMQTGQLGIRGQKHKLPHQQSQMLLAAATPSGVLLWVLEEAYAAAADQLVPPAPLRLLDKSAGASEALAMSCMPGQLLLAVGCNCTVAVWDLQQLEVLYRLEGHQGVITAVAFCPGHTNQLVTAAEDRTFKVWDLQAGQLLFQSSILGAAVPTCLAMDPACTRLAMGCADGSIRQFDLSVLPTCRELQVVDISKSMQQIAAAAVSAAAAAEAKQTRGPRTITAAAAGGGSAGLPALRQQLQQLTCLTASSNADASSSGDLVTLAVQEDASCCVLGMQYVQLQSSGTHSSSHSHQLLQELLAPPLQLLVCTRRGLLLVCLASAEVQQCYLFGTEASRVWDTISAAEQGCMARVPAAEQAYVSISQQQQQQLLQQQARWLPCFRALPDIEQPAAACCFALSAEQQQQQGQLVCCIASSFSSTAALLQLAPTRGTDASKYVAPGVAASNGSMLVGGQQLSVFQTQALPEGSPLLPKGARRSSSSSSSSSSGGGDGDGSSSATKQTPGSSSSRSAAPAVAAVAASRRATWGDASSSSSTSSGQGSAAAKPPPAPTSKPSPKPKALPADKAVTFHRRIKSSGYGFVQPKIKLGQAKPAPIKVGPKVNNVPQLLLQQLSCQKQYPLDSSGPPVMLQPDQGLPGDAAVHGGGIVRVEFAGDGCRLLTTSTDRTARCLWLPLSKHAGAGTTFVGHNGPVSSVCWSHDGEHLLTASTDRTARLWSCSEASPLITFNSLHQTTSSSSSTRSISRSSSSAGTSRAGRGSPGMLSRSSSNSNSTSASGGAVGSRSGKGSAGAVRAAVGAAASPASSSSGSTREFLAEVTAARFFYMDEIILLATGSKLYLYKYKLADAPADDDIQRLRSTGSYSLAGSYSSSCQAIGDVAGANSFLSTLLLLACSNRSIELVDAATLQVACTIPDAHSRPVQRLVQPAASPFVSHPREVHELFASAAPDGLVKLWDVRSGACVRSFSGHKHSSSQVPIGVAFSPCMHYLATGSEDKAAYIYDLRTCTVLNRLRPPGPADVVADVAFHPCKPQLVTGCMNGRLHWYADAC